MSAAEVRYLVEIGGARHEVALGADGSVVFGGRPREASLVEAGPGGCRSLLLDDRSVRLVARREGRGRWAVAVTGRTVDIEVREAREARIRTRTDGMASRARVPPLRAPMPGLVVRVAAREGDVVQAGATILIVEAMKMENELRAAAPARVARILVEPGDAVEKGQPLAEFEEPEAS